MSQGELCEVQKEVTFFHGSVAGDIVFCTMYKGHEGKHGCSIYEPRKDFDAPTHRLGGIEWE